jgi:ATP-binding cassette subfamily B protein
MRLTRQRRTPLAQVVRDELRPLGTSRRAARLLKLTVWSGFLAAPAWMSLTILVMLGAATAGVIYPLGYRMMVQAILRDDTGGIISGALITAGIFSLSWALTIIAATQSAGLTDRVNIWLSSRAGYLLASIPQIEHFERPDYLAEVDLFNQKRRSLAASPRLALSLFFTVARTAVIAVLLGSIDPVLGFLPLAAIAPLLGDDAGVRIQERMTQRMAETTRLSNELYTSMTTASTAQELRIGGVQRELQRRYDRLAVDLYRASSRATMLSFLCSVGGWLLYGLVFGGSVVALTVQAVGGQASPGDVVMAIVLVRQAQNQVGTVSDAFGQMITNVRTGLRLLWLESLADRARRRQAGTASVPPPARLTQGIAFDHVNFAYPGTDHMTLRDITVQLPPGTTVAIVGENGAGKSTLVKLLLKLYEPASGRITADGVSLADMDIDAWRARCAATFQDFVKFELTAGHIVGVGDLPRRDERDAVLSALEAVDGADIVPTLDSGLDTPIGWTFRNGRDLSGGQWQKLALARGSLRERPLVMVLDEPTASLDAQAEAALFSRLAKTARRATAGDAVTVFISHRFPSARIADLILVLDQGTIAEVGDHASLLAKGGIYAEMFELQAHAYRDDAGR